MTNFKTRLRPYRNGRIISAIRAVYFSGAASYASQFQHLFATYNYKGEMKRQVPVPMIALVATAVRIFYS